MSDILGGKLDSNEIRQKLLEHKFSSDFKLSKQLINEMLERFWFQDIFNSFVSDEHNLKYLIEYLNTKKPNTFSRYDFYKFFFDKIFPQRKSLQDFAMYFEKSQTDRLPLSEFKNLISKYDLTLDSLQEKRLVKIEHQENGKGIVVWEHHTLTEFLTTELLLEKENPIDEFEKLAILEQEGITAFKPSWAGVLRFLMQSKISEDAILWFVSFLEKHPENIDDNLSEIVVSLDIRKDDLRKRVFNLIYNSYFDRTFWLPYKVRSEFYKFIDAESYKRIKKDIKKWPDPTETFVKRGNVVGVIKGLLENESKLLTKVEKDFWKKTMIGFANSPEDDGNGVLQRFSLAALAHYKDSKIIPLVAESCFVNSKDKLVKDEFMQFCYNSDPNSKTTIDYLIEGVKKGSNIYARYGLYEISQKDSLEYFLKKVYEDIEFWMSFLKYSSVFSHSDSDDRLVNNIKKNLDKSILDLLKKNILKIFEADLYDEKRSFFIKEIVRLINDRDKNFLFEIIENIKAVDEKERFRLFHDYTEIIATLLTPENLNKYIDEIKKALLERFDMPIYAANRINKEVYNYAVKEKIITAVEDLPQPEWMKSDEEKEKIFLDEFHKLLEPSPGKYIPTIFEEYLQNREQLDKYFQTKEGRMAKARLKKLAVEEGIKKINPREIKVTITDKSKEGGRQFTWSLVAAYYGDILSVIKVLAPEELKKYRQNIIDFIPYAFSDDMSTIMDLIPEIKDKELSFVNKVMGYEKDDRRYLIPGTYIYLVGHYAKKGSKLPSALPVLKSFIGDESILDYDQESAIEKLSLFIDEKNKEIKKFLEDVFEDEEKNGKKNKLAIAANEVLIKVYKDEKAIDWRFEQIKRPLIFDRKAVEGIAHSVGQDEHEIYDMPFAGPLAELGEEKYLVKFLSLLDYSFKYLQENQDKQKQYWEYINYLWRIVINFVESLSKNVSFEPLQRLQTYVDEYSDFENSNWLQARIKELRKTYINRIGGTGA